MGVDSPNRVSTQTGAVFLSYASEDAEAAERICEALRSAGVEVWFDQSELRGGEAWDRQIRKQIHDCALFIPVISANAHARVEGYFRLEWKLAVDRSHLMAPDQTFLLPVVIDDTPQADERIPDRFRELQWSRVPDGHPSLAFVQRVQRLLSREPSGAQTTARPPTAQASGVVPTSQELARASWRSKPALLMIRSRRARWLTISVLAVALVGSIVRWFPSSQISENRTKMTKTDTVVNQKSVAVLPFLDLSEKKDQGYLADGIAEEVLNELAQVADLRVVGRTSSFQFRNGSDDLHTISERLGVRYVVEGSVRKSVDHVRVTAQLLDATTGTRLWVESFDRDFGDVLALQEQIATGIARALQIAVRASGGGSAPRLQNPDAYTAYLRGLWATDRMHQASLFEAQNNFERALSLEPSFLHAAEALARVHVAQAIDEAVEPKGAYQKARAAAEQALRIDANSAPAHGVLGMVYGAGEFNWVAAESEFKKALELNPRDATTLHYAAIVAQARGRREEALHRIYESLAIDPLDPYATTALGQMLYAAGDFDRAIPAARKALEINRGFDGVHYYLGLMLLLRGQQEAARPEIEAEVAENAHDAGLAMLYHSLGRVAESNAALSRLQASSSGRWPYGIAQAHAFRHDWNETLEWLDRARELRDPDFLVTQGDPLMDPVRKDPRYQAILRKMNLID